MIRRLNLKKDGSGGGTLKYVKWTFYLQIEQLADAAKRNDIDELMRLIENGVPVNSTDKVSAMYR